ncbi:MAG: lipoate--protein ligase family protein [Candidatus Omnitrophica bacterium]|nr:lipoate--protein ligase family protein [Candidatus Omnitrophota bacterium]
MNKKFLLVITYDVSPEMNMALDSVMWNKVKKNPEIAILRFYTWKPSGVSLGANQKPENLVDVEFCKKNNIPVVARVTGGSAIFHDIEITYSFSSINDEKLFTGPLTSYEKICSALKLGLERLGILVQWRGQSIGKEPSLTNRDCFSLSTRHDLIVDGKKIIGSAQRKDKTSFLQHGSLLLDIRKKLWEKIFLQRPDFSKIISLSEILNQLPAFEKIVSMLVSGFEQFFQQKFERIEFSPQDIEEARKIAEDFALIRSET